MNRTRIAALIAPAFALAACEQQAAEQVAPTPTSEVSATPAAPVAPPPSPPPSPIPTTTPSASAQPSLPALNPEAERGETGARDVLLDFARAIELRRFDQAWALLSPADHRKWSRADFRSLFADLRKLIVAVPTGTLEGAAGSSYYTAPVTITGTDLSGRPVRIEGEAVLRRVNDIDGATSAQRRWHFQSLKLDWTH